MIFYDKTVTQTHLECQKVPQMKLMQLFIILLAVSSYSDHRVITLFMFSQFINNLKFVVEQLSNITESDKLC